MELSVDSFCVLKSCKQLNNLYIYKGLCEDDKLIYVIMKDQKNLIIQGPQKDSGDCKVFEESLFNMVSVKFDELYEKSNKTTI